MKIITSTAARKPKFIKNLLIVLCTLCLAINTYSQERKSFVINPGQNISDVISAIDIYRYNEFKLGTVYFKDKRESNAKLNYNRLLDEFQFIDAKGDTVSIADENFTELVKINNDTFYYNKGYYELITSMDSLQLVRKETITISSTNKIGAYNQLLQGGAATSYTKYSLSGRSANLVVNEKVTLKKEVSYHFLDKEYQLKPVSKKELKKEIPEFDSAIEQYIANNSVNFKNEADLKKLLNYLKQYHL